MEIKPVQLLGQVGADNLGAVQAEDGVHNGAGHIMLRQSLGSQLGLALAGLQGGHVQIAVDVGVVGGKMAVDHLQRHAAILRQDFDDAVFHKF